MGAGGTGLGMNADELKRNAALTEHVVRDLNAGKPQLPLAMFDTHTHPAHR